MFSYLSSSSISLATLTPSFVTVGAPHFLSSTTLRPFGPSVAFTAALSFATPWLAHRAPGAQERGELTLEPAAGLDIQRLVDRLGRHTHLRVVGELQDESARDLLRALTQPQPHLNLAPQAQIRGQLRRPRRRTSQVHL